MLFILSITSNGQNLIKRTTVVKYVTGFVYKYELKNEPDVFLVKDTEKVGIAGEIVKVKSGFAINFLIPKGLAVVITFGVLGYQLFVQKRAISDNVWTQEVVKKHLPLDLKEKIYGGGTESGQAGIIQSKTTQKIVKGIKNKLPKGWKIMKKD